MNEKQAKKIRRMKQIMAWTGIIVLALLYIITFIIGIMGKAGTQKLLLACIIGTVLVPVTMYAMIRITDTLSGKNTAPFSMSIRTNEFKELKLRKTIQSVADVRDAIDTRVSLTDIFQQKMPLFMFGNDSDVIPKGFYGMANKYFSAFLKAAFEFEISDTSKPSRFDALFDEESKTSAKTDALKAIIDIFETDFRRIFNILRLLILKDSEILRLICYEKGLKTPDFFMLK